MILKRWTENGALRASNARFRKARKLLEEVAYLWGDVDNCAVTGCDELVKLIDALQLDIVLGAQARAEDCEAQT